LILVTGNEHKWLEAQRILGRPLGRAAIDLPEIQAPTTAEVAREDERRGEGRALPPAPRLGSAGAPPRPLRRVVR
jgi:hypothetical protein